MVPGPARRDVEQELVVFYFALMEACRGAAPAVEEAICCAQLYVDVFEADSAVKKMGAPLEVFSLDLNDPNEAKRRKERESVSRSSRSEREYSHLCGSPLWRIIKKGEEVGGLSSADGDPYYDLMQYEYHRYEPTDYQTAGRSSARVRSFGLGFRGFFRWTKRTFQKLPASFSLIFDKPRAGSVTADPFQIAR